MQFQIRTHHNDRTTGIVDPLTEEVLTETTLLGLAKHGRSVASSGDESECAVPKKCEKNTHGARAESVKVSARMQERGSLMHVPDEEVRFVAIATCWCDRECGCGHMHEHLHQAYQPHCLTKHSSVAVQ